MTDKKISNARCKTKNKISKRIKRFNKVKREQIRKIRGPVVVTELRNIEENK